MPLLALGGTSGGTSFKVGIGVAVKIQFLLCLSIAPGALFHLGRNAHPVGDLAAMFVGNEALGQAGGAGGAAFEDEEVHGGEV